MTILEQTVCCRAMKLKFLVQVTNSYIFRYMNQIDRCLRGFESTSEWADLIAALSKLNKVSKN